jgi:hypothetical protein
MPFVFLQIFIKHGLNLRMSFILTIFCKLIYSLVAVARDVLFKELFEQPLILCFAFFFLPGRLPEVPRARACSRCVSHYSHSTRKKGRITEAASMTLESTNMQTLSPSAFFIVRNFFITTSKRKAPESASRSTALTRARREKLKN